MTTLPAAHGSPWWRYPFMWLVLGGPATVVVAAIATAVIAFRGADPVLTVDATPLAHSAAPALHARNHAATQAPAEP
jgi:hypothetical protein